MNRPRKRGVAGAGGGGSSRSFAVLVSLLLVDAADSFWATPTSATARRATASPTAVTSAAFVSSAGRSSYLRRGNNGVVDGLDIRSTSRLEMLCGPAGARSLQQRGGHGLVAPSTKGSLLCWSSTRPIAFSRQQASWSSLIDKRDSFRSG